jgi:hypothetical protein
LLLLIYKKLNKKGGKMTLSKVTLIMFAVVVALMGILGFIPGAEYVAKSVWYYIFQIVISIVAIILASVDNSHKKRKK